MRNPDKKIYVVTAAIVLMLLVLAARLWELQVVRGERFTEQAFENRLRIEQVPAPRGIIFDRRGIPLVKNAPFYSVALVPKLLPEADLEAIADFLGMEIKEVGDIVRRNRNSIEPIRIKGGLRFDEVAFIEARLSDFPALVIDVDETRHYPYGKTVAHVVGYLGKLGPDQIRKKEFRDVPRQSFIGQWGVEKMYDSHLRGIPGRRVYEADALGRKLRLLSEDQAARTGPPPEHRPGPPAGGGGGLWPCRGHGGHKAHHRGSPRCQ
ncbi:hypothetical protein LCGC14_2070790 [marine sediment metagenome]|uniref:beta-lactamase n=1 Tax=marine sediment metagenome TaxID=412755 RepID=A0A0F9GWX0_9ZZZZ